MFTKEDCSKNLQIKNRSLSCQRWSLHGFQTLHFICNLFGSKLWLQSIQNYAWHCFQAFARRHLKSLRCSIWIWADALSSDRSSIQTCCFAQDSIRNISFCSYVINFCSETNEWLKDWAKQWALPWQATTSRKFHWIFISPEKRKWLVAARNLQSIETLLTLELSQYRKSGSMFSSSEPVAASSDCHWLGNALCLCSPVLPWQAEPEGCPKSLAVDFALNSITFWNSLQRDCQMTGRGSNLDSNLNSAAWPTSCKGFIASEITA